MVGLRYKQWRAAMGLSIAALQIGAFDSQRNELKPDATSSLPPPEPSIIPRLTLTTAIGVLR